MTDLVAELAAQGRSLSPEERVRLLDLPLESLQPTTALADDEAWARKSSGARALCASWTT